MKNSANKVAMNTSILYFRMLITMLITLYSTRLVLNALGVVDYGTYNLTGGVIAMLSFLNVAMTVSTQRFMSYALGTLDKTKLNNVFNSSILLHFVIGVIIILLFEVIGIFVFDSVLNIPIERISAAKTIYQFMVISSFFTIISVPYDALINSHENMVVVAVLGIVEAFIKLAIALIIVNISWDKLIVYGACLTILSLMLLGAKRIYCYYKYPEVRVNFRKYVKKDLFTEILYYSGWNMLGASIVVGNGQGIAVILNVFFGTIINAAYGIATQINSQLSLFSMTMLQALNPQIVKSESNGDRMRMLKLSMMACKFSFFLLSFFAIPVLFEMSFILKIWLGKVPNYTVDFCRIIIVTTMVSQLSIGLQTSIHAIGKIKGYTLGMALILIWVLPLSYMLLKWGFPAYKVLILNIIIEIISLIFRVFMVRYLAKLSIRDYFKTVLLPSLLTVSIVIGVILIPYHYMNDNASRFFYIGIIHVVLMLFFAAKVGLSDSELSTVKKIINTLTLKIFKRQWLGI